MGLGCVIAAIVVVLFIYIPAIAYFGICGYNCYVKYTCYDNFPFYFRYPFILTQFVYGFFILLYNAITKGKTGITDCSF
jgi:hypothetical protein